MTSSVAVKHVQVGAPTIGNDQPLTVIAGPCALESEQLGQDIAGRMKEVCDAAGAQYVFKASYDKANRTSLSGGRGLGMEAGLAALQSIKDAQGVPILTDVHSEAQCAPVAQVADILQIPAFLCRQTDMLLAAGQTGAVVNVKKGQFLAPWEMPNIVAKIESTGNGRILLTERGTSFGYNTLVADMRSLPQMAQTGYPVVMDATHSVQQPGGLGSRSGGQSQYVPLLARAAVAAGVSGVFMETHPDPANALSDGPNALPLDRFEGLVSQLLAIDEIAKSDPPS